MISGDILGQAWPARGVTRRQHMLLCLHPLRFLHYHHEIQAALVEVLGDLIRRPGQADGRARRNAVRHYLASEYTRHVVDEDEVLQRFVSDGLRRDGRKDRVAAAEHVFAISRAMHEEGSRLASTLIARLTPSDSLLEGHALPLWIPPAIRYFKQSTHHLEWEATVLYPAVALAIGGNDCGELGRRIAGRRQVAYMHLVRAPEPLPGLRRAGPGSRRRTYGLQ